MKLVFMLFSMLFSLAVSCNHENKKCESKAEHLGCFKVSNRNGLKGFIFSYASLTPDTCTNECKLRGFLYAGLQNGKDCYCGNDEDVLMKKANDEHDCDLNCSGDSSKKCGGRARANIYRVATCLRVVKTLAKRISYLGCFKDTDGKLKGYKYSDRHNTVDSCIHECQEKGYLFAALHRGDTCFCGNEHAILAERKPHSECSVPCSGICPEPCSLRTCGGDASSAVYAIGQCMETPFFPFIKDEKIKYLGCFGEAEQRQQGYWFTKVDMSTNECIQTCQIKGFLYASLVSGKSCYCSKDQAILSAVADSARCDMNCLKEGWKCGGLAHASVYSLRNCETADQNQLSHFYMGCYVTRRTTMGKTLTSDREMTQNFCSLECNKEGYLYASLTGGNTCHCNNEHKSYYDRLPDAQCDLPCSGAPSIKCGGKTSDGVFSVGLCRHATYSNNRSQSLGCYQGKSASPTLTGYRFRKDTLEIRDCLSTCRTKGFMFAAVHAGKVCACGNDFVQDEDKVDESECADHCWGENWKCGAYRRFNLYQIKSCEKVEELYAMPPYIGCYVDRLDRLLKGRFYADGALTHKKCFRVCKEANFLYAGVEAGSQCFCGNKVPPLADRLSNSECNWTCVGDKTTFCGAWWKVAVYGVGTCKKEEYDPDDDEISTDENCNGMSQCKNPYIPRFDGKVPSGDTNVYYSDLLFPNNEP